MCNWMRMSLKTSAPAAFLPTFLYLPTTSFYGGPLRGIFNTLKRRHILRDVQTLILDGLSVTSDLVSDIITQDSFNVRILSIREVQNLNERKVQQALCYAIRPSRAVNTPRLQGLYIFGPKDVPLASRFQRHVHSYPPGIVTIDTMPSYGGVTSSQGAQIGSQLDQKSENVLVEEMARDGDKWYQKSGKVIPKPPSGEWADVMLACLGIISFDAVLCGGPRHSTFDVLPADTPDAPTNLSTAYLSARIASHAVQGCSGCNTAPEGFSKFGVSPMEQFPLLAPPPLHSSTVKSAKTPSTSNNTPPSEAKLIARCLDCLRNRYCESCHKWWCENCYSTPNQGFNIPTSPQPWQAVGSSLVVVGEVGDKKNVKVHMGLCVDGCLVGKMMSGAGSNGMCG
jgi:hypothetical protein